MGDVYLARPRGHVTGIPSPVVIKRMHGRYSDDGTDNVFVRRFEHEAALATRIDSPFVAKVYDAGRVRTTLYMVQELISGWTLLRLRKTLPKLPLPALGRIAADALDGLSAIHSAADADGNPLGIVHRDVSPNNIMLDDEGRTRLIDLGIGKSRLQDWKTSTGAIMGSPGYMSPEHVGAKDIDQRADLYALAVVIFELMTGAPYIERGTVPRMLANARQPKFRPPSRLRPEVTEAVDRVLARALAVDPNERFDSAAELKSALGRVLPPGRPLDAKALVADAMWNELGDHKTQIAQIARLESPEPATPSEPSAEAVVFARRPPSPPPRSNRTGILLWAALAVLMTLTAVLVTRADQAPGEAPPPPAASPPSPAPTASAIPRVTPDPEPDPPPERPRPKPKRRRRPPTKRNIASPPAPPPTPSRAPTPSATLEGERRRIRAMIARVKKLPGSGAKTRLLEDLLLHAASKNLAKEVTETNALRDRLRALE